MGIIFFFFFFFFYFFTYGVAISAVHRERTYGIVKYKGSSWRMGDREAEQACLSGFFSLVAWRC